MSERLKNVIAAQLNIKEMSDYYPERRIAKGQAVRPYIVLGGKELLQFGSLDYLGLASDERVIEAEAKAARKYGCGALPSRMVIEMDINKELERKIAGFMGEEDSVVFTSGSAANHGTIPAVIASPLSYLCPGENTRASRAVFIDELSHSSAKDAAYLTRGANVKVINYRSGDMQDLEHKLNLHKTDLNLIVTDGIFSTSGGIAPLEDICVIAEVFGAVVYVDDAHATGILGKKGRGTCELAGVGNRVDVKMGVISKALGSMGGFIVGEKWFIEYIRHSRPQIHSMPLSPGECGAAIKALEIAQSEPWRRQQVLALADKLRFGLKQIGFDTLSSSTQVVPILIGDELLARQFADDLEEKGIFCPPFEYPAVPKGEAVLRFCPTALHDLEDIDHLLGVIKGLFSKYLQHSPQNLLSKMA
ncbi:MAG: pyridoxal phosphate-dependent aminotransferase family protein [Patescibacteria group bacterium]|nr:pyridoxal phosphate-dependent aminotransferase family protein [Patescibacteria group bacterium]